MHQRKKVSREIFDKIEEIANLSSEGGYIYRGEPEHYEKVCSALYRECQHAVKKAGLENELVNYDIEVVENEILDQVKRYIPPNDVAQDFSILTQLQHYGSPTNLIDFTTDFHIALFFACDSQPNKNGRVIVQKRDFVSIKVPSEPSLRVTAQKSVFVQPKQGYIDINEAKFQIVNIPMNLKAPMLEYLRNSHSISTETIYNDIHGYIRNQGVHESAYNEFYIALVYQSTVSENLTSTHESWGKAIEHYDKAIERNPNFLNAYINRSVIYIWQDQYELALQDCNRAIELEPDFFLVYSNRANAYFKQDQYELALQDCNKAIELEPDSHLAYCTRGDVYSKQDQCELALQNYNKAIELETTYVPPYNNRSAIYIKQERYELALRDIDRIIELDSENAVAYYNRGFVNLQLQRHDEVFPNWDKALQIIYDSQESHSDAGSVYARRVDDDNMPVVADAPQEYKMIVDNIKENLRNNVRNVLDNLQNLSSEVESES